MRPRKRRESKASPFERWPVLSAVSIACVVPLENLPMLGVNATADSTNRLSVASAAVLLDNIGAGTQLKLNKAGAGDTASLLYQTASSARAVVATRYATL